MGLSRAAASAAASADAEMHEAQPCDSIHATDLPKDLDEEQLKEIFGAYGTVVYSKIMKAQGKLSAIVQFSSVDDATFVVQNPDVLGFAEQPTLCFRQRVQKASAGSGPKPTTSSAPKPPPAGPAKTPKAVDRYSPYGGKGAGGGKGSCSGGKGGGGGKGGVGKGRGGKNFGDITALKKGMSKGRLLPAHEWHQDEGSVFISGLPSNTTDLDLYEIFAPFGAIPPKGVKAMKKGDVCTGIGFVDFIDPACADAAINTVNGYAGPTGAILNVSLKTPGKASRKG